VAANSVAHSNTENLTLQEDRGSEVTDKTIVLATNLKSHTENLENVEV
jgi:hypothetical protein